LIVYSITVAHTEAQKENKGECAFCVLFHFLSVFLKQTSTSYSNS